MKALLIFPNQDHIVLPGYMKTVQEGLGFLPPLGLLYVGGYLKEKTAHDVEIIDGLLLGLTYPEMEARVRAATPEVVGIYAMTFTLPDVKMTIEVVRKAAPAAPIVIGGPHTSLFPLETLAFDGVDYIVLGEGEVPFARLVDRLQEAREGKRDPDPLKISEGLAGVMGRGATKAKPRFFQSELDELVYPRRDLTPYKEYHTVVSRRPPTTTMFSSRGCPYGCVFCYTAGGKKFRERPVTDVVQEMCLAHEMGINEFLFFDETFTLQKQRIEGMCHELLRVGLDVTWDVRARVDCVDPDLLKLMRRAGCGRVQYGVESGTPRVLKILNKGITREDIVNAFRWTKEAGLLTYADFMIGSPGETEEEILETMRFARRIDPDYVHFSITVPLPETQLHTWAVEKGIITENTWRDYAADPSPDFQVPYWEEMFTRDELEKLVWRCINGFYLRPQYVLKGLRRARSWGEIKRQGKAALGLFARAR